MAQTGFTPIQLYFSTTASAVPIAGNLANGELAINITDGKLYYKNNGGTVTLLAGAGGAGIAAGSNTQIQFNNAGSFGASASLTWSGTVLGTTGFTASSDSSFTSTGALTISKGTTGQRPTATSGMLRFNTTTTEFEGYNGTAWASVGGAAIVNDVSTSSNIYPISAAATSGTASTVYTSNAKFLYKPSTGELQASALVASNGIVVNSQTVATSYTIAAGQSAMSSGPVTLSGGVVVTVSSGSRWVVL